MIEILSRTPLYFHYTFQESYSKTLIHPEESITSELAKQGVYSKLEQKNVTAWLDLRNKAAHGKYSEYNDNQAK